VSQPFVSSAWLLSRLRRMSTAMLMTAHLEMMSDCNHNGYLPDGDGFGQPIRHALHTSEPTLPPVRLTHLASSSRVD
jgi:hypothetical protein